MSFLRPRKKNAALVPKIHIALLASHAAPPPPPELSSEFSRKRSHPNAIKMYL